MALKITRRKDRRHYWITGSIDGVRIRQSAGTSDKVAAKLKAKAIEREFWERRSSGEKEAVTFDMAAQNYMDGDGEARFMPPLLHYFGGFPVADIKPGHIHDAARELYPGRKPATWNRNVVVPAQAVINHAADRGWCSPIRVKKFTEEAPERRAADREWIEAFMGAAGDTLAALALFMFTTGARISDALSLTWDGVEERSAWIETKTGPREAVLSQEMAARLQALRLSDKAHPERPFRWKRHWSVYKPWYAACDRAGIERIPPHQAGRHAFATEMIVKGGVDPATTAMLGGWASPRILMDRYVHPDRPEAVIDNVFGTPAPKAVSGTKKAPK